MISELNAQEAMSMRAPVDDAHDNVAAGSAADRVAGELQTAILTGRLRPEQRLSIRELANDFGVSLIPVREALRALEAEGLVSTQRGHGATVAPLTVEEVRAIFRLRRQIEPELAALAAAVHDEAHLAALQGATVDCGHRSPTVEQHYRIHHHRHMQVLGPAMNRWDHMVVSTLLTAASRYQRLGLTPGTADQDCAQHRGTHRELLNAYRAHEPARARAIMHSYLDNIERSIVQSRPPATSGEA